MFGYKFGKASIPLVILRAGLYGLSGFKRLPLTRGKLAAWQRYFYYFCPIFFYSIVCHVPKCIDNVDKVVTFLLFFLRARPILLRHGDTIF